MKIIQEQIVELQEIANTQDDLNLPSVLAAKRTAQKGLEVIETLQKELKTSENSRLFAVQLKNNVIEQCKKLKEENESMREELNHALETMSSMQDELNKEE